MKTLTLSIIFLGLSSISLAQSPGNVSSNLVLWLKADGNVYNSGTTQASNGQTISKWDGAGSTTTDANEDTGGAGNNGKPIFKTSTATNINYNPVISFDGTQRFRLSANTLNPGAANNAMYVVKATSSGTIFVQEAAGAVIPKLNSDGSLVLSKNAGWANISGGGDGGGATTFNSFTKTNSNVVNTYLAGKEFTSFAMSASPRSSLAGTNYIGERATCCSSPLNGNIAEIIGYNQTTLSGTDKSQIDSYLAMKYAITLDNTGGGSIGDYRFSDGSVIWDASINSSYQNSIVALARDDNSQLIQKQSHTSDDTTRAYLSTLATNNSGNAGSFSSNLQSVIIGDNAMKLASLGSNEFPSSQGIYSRLEREWKVTNSNFTGTFSLDITLDNPGSITASDLRILIDTDGDFTNATLYNPTITYAAGIVTISGLSTSEIPAGSTRYFTIVSMNSATPLPVELANFNATMLLTEVELTWETASEINNDYFSVERSDNSTSWEELTKINGAGNSTTLLNYRYMDKQPLKSASYYRLKQTDNNGQFSYSQVMSVNNVTTGASDIQIYPNPTMNVVTLETKHSVFDTILVYDVYGRNITSLLNFIEISKHKVMIDLSNLDSGVYSIQTGNTVKRIIKQ
ncbi:MAG: hypothetical protein ACJASQ_003732 [Crocinitomicaceae bacterium]|jgi:hypothetical protein